MQLAEARILPGERVAQRVTRAQYCSNQNFNQKNTRSCLYIHTQRKILPTSGHTIATMTM